MPRNARSLGDKWLGEVGYAICCSSLSAGTAFLWSKDQLSTQTVKGFTAGTGQRIGLCLDMESTERTLDYYIDGERVQTAGLMPAFNRLPPGPLYPACSNGFDKSFCRDVKIFLELPVPPAFYKDREKRREEAIRLAAEATSKAAAAPQPAIGMPTSVTPAGQPAAQNMAGRGGPPNMAGGRGAPQMAGRGMPAAGAMAAGRGGAPMQQAAAARPGAPMQAVGRGVAQQPVAQPGYTAGERNVACGMRHTSIARALPCALAS